MDNWFEFRGELSTDYGLILKNEHTITGPESNAQLIDVPGRSSPLILDDGTFASYDETYKCGSIGRDRIEERARRIKGWLQSSREWGYLRDWRDSDYYREATCISRIDLERAVLEFGSAIVIFKCKPFKKLLVGLETVTLTAEKMLYNAEAFNSEPYLKVYGSGDVTIYVNNQSINLKGVEDYIEIDSEMKNCFKGTQAQNDRLRSDWPIFLPGENNISWTGTVEKLEIIPRWRTLGA